MTCCGVRPGAKLVHLGESAKPRDRKYYFPMACFEEINSALGGFKFSGPKPCEHSEKRSLCERLLGEVPGVSARGLATFRIGIEILKKKINKSGPMEPWSIERVLKRYSGAKRTKYCNAHHETLLTGYEKLQARVSMFVKAEKLPCGKPARTVQGRSPQYNIQVLPYFKAIESRVFGFTSLVNGNRSRIFGAGLSNDAAAELILEKWNNFSDPVALSIDYSRFDKHVNVRLLELEHSVYRAAFPGDEKFSRMLRAQLVNKGCSASGAWKYSVQGTRASGDVNTLLGNCVINAAMVLGIAKRRNLRLDLLVVGDDSVLFMERKDLEKVQAAIVTETRQMGFVADVERIAYIPQRIIYCRQSPLQRDDGSWTLVRDPKYSIMGFASSHKHYNNPGGLRILRTVALCEGLATRGIPLVHRMACRVNEVLSDRSLSKAVFTDSDMYGWRHRANIDSTLTPEELVQLFSVKELEYHKPSDYMRAQYETAFDLSVETQLAFEDLLNTWEPPTTWHTLVRDQDPA